MSPLLHPDVLRVFLAFSIPLEGCILWMYADSLALITIGIGCLLRTVDQALSLPFIDRLSRRPATAAEIRLDWASVTKNRARLAVAGAAAAERFTSLELTREGVDTLAKIRLQATAADLEQQFPDWRSWPPSVQLALCSLAWAVGSQLRPTPLRRGWPKLCAALDARDWVTAGDEIVIDAKLGTPQPNPGVVPRNWANQRLLWAVATAEAAGQDVSGVLVGYATSHRAPPERPVLAVPPVPDPDATPVIPQPLERVAKRSKALADATTMEDVHRDITDDWRSGRPDGYEGDK